MPPRREHGGRAVVITPKVRALQRQVEALQEQICRGLNVATGNKSEEENEEQTNVAQEGAGKEEVLNEAKERLFRAISKLGKRPKIDVGEFLGNLKSDELINWINELEEYFEYEDIRYLERVNFAKAKMKGHAKM